MLTVYTHQVRHLSSTDQHSCLLHNHASAASTGIFVHAIARHYSSRCGPKSEIDSH